MRTPPIPRRGFVSALAGTIAARAIPSPLLALPRPPSPEDPYALILGTIQDGGLPQVGCYTPRCNRARSSPRYVTSLALVEPDAERYYLVDATPDITRQVDLIDEAGFRERAGARRPFDGIFLTHAHIGHYLGLALLGREALGMGPTPVYCTPKMAEYLATNGPWSLLVDEGRIHFPPAPLDTWLEVDEWLSVRMIPVPHRPEFSDTVGFMFRGPRRSIMYVPDIDRWEAWQYDVRDLVGQVDAALLDASFYSASEVPGRRVEDIPHPLVPHSMALLQDVVSGEHRVVFTHFNNTNAILDDGVEAAAVRERGFEIAREGMRLPL